jgi:hypothetical protein
MHHPSMVMCSWMLVHPGSLFCNLPRSQKELTIQRAQNAQKTVTPVKIPHNTRSKENDIVPTEHSSRCSLFILPKKTERLSSWRHTKNNVVSLALLRMNSK